MRLPLCFTCWAAVIVALTAEQQLYYCGSNNHMEIKDRDFYIISRPQSLSLNHQTGSSCELTALSSSNFLVEIESLSLRNGGAVTISSKGEVLFRGSRVQPTRARLATSVGQLKVQFESEAYGSGHDNIRIRVRTFDPAGCPPDWSYLYGNCFGISGINYRRMNFSDAQAACNSMRSNLMQLPYGYNSIGSIGSFMVLLSAKLRYQPYLQFSWIGLADRNPYQPYWLNGERQINDELLEFSCLHGGSYRDKTCKLAGSCYAVAWYDGHFAVFKTPCEFEIGFVCSMPPGGTDNFYAKPSDGITKVMLVIGATFGSILLIGCVYIFRCVWRRNCCRSCCFRRQMQADQGPEIQLRERDTWPTTAPYRSARMQIGDSPAGGMFEEPANLAQQLPVHLFPPSHGAVSAEASGSLPPPYDESCAIIPQRIHCASGTA